MVPSEFVEPLEEQTTKWLNPLPHDQYVDLFHGDERRPTRYRWGPGETKTLPSKFDFAIHRVDNGVIIGGLAPQLVKVGSDEKLDPALDTDQVKRRQAEVEAAAAALTQKQAGETLLVAQAKLAEANDALAAKSEAPERPMPPEKRARG